MTVEDSRKQCSQEIVEALNSHCERLESMGVRSDQIEMVGCLEAFRQNFYHIMRLDNENSRTNTSPRQ